jgi:hypothetical protein
MKKNEIALLVLVVAMVGFIAFLVGNSIFGGKVSKPVDVETATAISPDIVQPSGAVFNENAINPTVPIKIGGGDGATPFSN